jgi:hypothetical protein
MSAKRGGREGTEEPAPQDPRDMVKAELLEPQPPAKHADPPIQCLKLGATDRRRLKVRRRQLPVGGRWEKILLKGANEAPKSR